MSDLDVKRLNELTDELEKRVKSLEASKVKKEEVTTIQKVYSGLLTKPTNKKKFFKFVAKKTSYAILNFEISSPLSFDATFELFLNGELVLSEITSLPIVHEIPILANVGENVLTFSFGSDKSANSIEYSIQIVLKGQVEIQESQPILGIMMDEVVCLKQDDTIKCYNSNTMAVISCYSGKDVVAGGGVKGNFIFFLISEGGKTTLERHIKDKNDSYKTIVLNGDFSDCVVEYNNGVTYAFMRRGENLYLYGYVSETNSFLQKLPFRAVNIKNYQGNTGRYFYFKDKYGNYNVVKHYSYLDYREEKVISLGKLQNANLCEENGRLIVLYKDGLVVMKKPVFEQEEPTLVGIGDEAIITEQGVTVIRKENTLIKL